MKNKLFLAVFSWLMISTSVYAADWYVDGSAAQSGGKSWSSPLITIQGAIDAAGSGDEIWVKMGNILLSATINVNKPVNIYGGFNGDIKNV